MMLKLAILAYRALPGSLKVSCPRSPTCSARGLAVASQGAGAVLGVIAQCSGCKDFYHEHPNR